MSPPEAPPRFPARRPTLSALLAHPELGMRLLHGSPTQLDAEISWAHPSELPDPSGYLRPGELLCTVGSTLLTREACHRLCAAVARTESAGVCFGLGDVADQVPLALIEAAEAFGLPLVTIPSGVPFTRLNDALQEARVDPDEAPGVPESAHRSAAVQGAVLDLIASGLASPMALQEPLRIAGVPGDRLVVGVWPAAAWTSVLSRIDGEQALLARTEQYTVTLSDERFPEELIRCPEAVPHGFSEQSQLHDLPQALLAARQAYARAAYAKHAPLPEHAASLPELLSGLPDSALSPFVTQLISPLLRVDEQRGSELLSTLRVFLREEGSLQETANATFLHVNSVRHRLNRIHELTGCDPLRYSDRVNLHIGLWAVDRQRKYRGAVGDEAPGSIRSFISAAPPGPAPR